MTNKTARAPRSAFDEMVAAGLITDLESAYLTLRYSSPDVVSALCGPCPWPVREPVTASAPKPKRKPSFARQIKQAKKAGATSIERDGATVSLVEPPGVPADDNSINEWDEVLPKGTLQ